MRPIDVHAGQPAALLVCLHWGTDGGRVRHGRRLLGEGAVACSRDGSVLRELGRPCRRTGCRRIFHRHVVEHRVTEYGGDSDSSWKSDGAPCRERIRVVSCACHCGERVVCCLYFDFSHRDTRVAYTHLHVEGIGSLEGVHERGGPHVAFYGCPADIPDAISGGRYVNGSDGTFWTLSRSYKKTNVSHFANRLCVRV